MLSNFAAGADECECEPEFSVAHPTPFKFNSPAFWDDLYDLARKSEDPQVVLAALQLSCRLKSHQSLEQPRAKRRRIGNAVTELTAQVEFLVRPTHQHQRTRLSNVISLPPALTLPTPSFDPLASSYFAQVGKVLAWSQTVGGVPLEVTSLRHQRLFFDVLTAALFGGGVTRSAIDDSTLFTSIMLEVANVCCVWHEEGRVLSLQGAFSDLPEPAQTTLHLTTELTEGTPEDVRRFWKGLIDAYRTMMAERRRQITNVCLEIGVDRDDDDLRALNEILETISALPPHSYRDANGALGLLISIETGMEDVETNCLRKFDLELSTYLVRAQSVQMWRKFTVPVSSEPACPSKESCDSSTASSEKETRETTTPPSFSRQEEVPHLAPGLTEAFTEEVSVPKKPKAPLSGAAREMIDFIRKASDHADVKINPFVILGLDPQTTSEVQLKRFKHRVSLHIHPDKIGRDKPEYEEAQAAYTAFAQALELAIEKYRDGSYRSLKPPPDLAPFAQDLGVLPNESDKSDDDAPLVFRRTTVPDTAPSIDKRIHGKIQPQSSMRVPAGSPSARTPPGNSHVTRVRPSATTPRGPRDKASGLSKYVAQPSPRGTTAHLEKESDKVQSPSAAGAGSSIKGQNPLYVGPKRSRTPILDQIAMYAFDKLRAPESPVCEAIRLVKQCPLSFRAEQLGPDGLSVVVGYRPSVKERFSMRHLNLYVCHPFSGNLEVSSDSIATGLSESIRLASRLAVVNVYASLGPGVERARLYVDPIPLVGGPAAAGASGTWCSWWIGIQCALSAEENGSGVANMESTKIFWRLVSAQIDGWLVQAKSEQLRNFLRFFKFSSNSIYGMKLQPNNFSTRALRVKRLEELQRLAQEVIQDTNQCPDHHLIPGNISE